MLNKITGWFIFVQLGYVSLFIAISIINYATDGEVVSQLTAIRDFIGISNRKVSLNKCVCYPLAFSAPINIILALIFFWSLLRKNNGIDFTKGFFNCINAIYVTSCSWFFMSIFCNIVN
jgi:hypothetical protein